MSSVPNIEPGNWSAVVNSGATWPATTISFTRDGVAVIPVSAALTVHDPSGNLVLTIAATIDGGGVMTIAGLTADETATLTFDYGNMLFRTVESGSVVTDLLAGNMTVINRGN